MAEVPTGADEREKVSVALYCYVGDVNGEVDVFGLACSHSAKNPKELHAAIKDKWGDTMGAKDMREIQNTADRIKLRDRSAYPNNDGTRFKNSHEISPNAQRLNTSEHYNEWTVKTPGVGNRGERRIVVSKTTDKAYYTHDHYDSYIEIDLGGW